MPSQGQSESLVRCLTVPSGPPLTARRGGGLPVGPAGGALSESRSDGSDSLAAEQSSMVLVAGRASAAAVTE